MISKDQSKASYIPKLISQILELSKICIEISWSSWKKKKIDWVVPKQKLLV